jgi:hypothetical protein
MTKPSRHSAWQPWQSSTYRGGKSVQTRTIGPSVAHAGRNRHTYRSAVGLARITKKKSDGRRFTPIKRCVSGFARKGKTKMLATSRRKRSLRAALRITPRRHETVVQRLTLGAAVWEFEPPGHDHCSFRRVAANRSFGCRPERDERQGARYAMMAHSPAWALFKSAHDDHRFSAPHRSQGISLPQQLRKLRNIRRDAPRLVAGNCWIQRAVREVRSGSATSRGRG